MCSSMIVLLSISVLMEGNKRHHHHQQGIFSFKIEQNENGTFVASLFQNGRHPKPQDDVGKWQSVLHPKSWVLNWRTIKPVHPELPIYKTLVQAINFMRLNFEPPHRITQVINLTHFGRIKCWIKWLCWVAYWVQGFVRSIIRSFVCSVVRLFVRSIDRSFVRSFVYLFVCLFVPSFVQGRMYIILKAHLFPSSVSKIEPRIAFKPLVAY